MSKVALAEHWCLSVIDYSSICLVPGLETFSQLVYEDAYGSVSIPSHRSITDNCYQLDFVIGLDLVFVPS